ncbi:methyltransferase [Nodosilinea sp. PGN35]|uniref:methyltransferase n=1 Tax=Nodosilinea sp. PGN35 TaxID=3020489 RepID=UPI0023B2F2FF|nr:methyltransferase [Nodosilinea sp. TSF1-S3]MDF0368211.1 methyltransferase [Nodosilinea sp. TSF1-S3]
MNELSEVNRRVSWRYLFYGQLSHGLLVLVLVPGAIALAEPGLTGRMVWGLSDRQWAYGLVAVAVTHQVLVWLLWRLQLCFGTLSRWLGRADLVVWSLMFFPLLVARPLLTAAVAVSSAGSLTMPIWVAIPLGAVLLGPALYTFWSVQQYFGLLRAAGGDHFRARYWTMPLVHQGAFRYSGNAMYSFGFLALWAIAVWGRSRPALALALFQHAYIWVHLYCTEAPDLALLYGATPPVPEPPDPSAPEAANAKDH